MNICVAKACTGCGACVNRCKRDAIRMAPNPQGFWMPVIDNERCVSCGQCVKVCPQNQQGTLHAADQVLAVLAKDDALRESSSSGGVFSLLAHPILREGGAVFGAAFDSDWRVAHVCVQTEEELKRLRGSKYVQSDIRLTYREAEVLLKQDKPVLFSGTPCQIAGLKQYLGKDYDRLLTVDLVCHGAPSPHVYHTWLSWEQEQHGPIEAIEFRKKSPGWKQFCAQITFVNGDTTQCMLRESYIGGFLRDLYLRDSCYQCPYAKRDRVGDITLGDYWGYRETGPEHIEDDDRGISLVMLNTAKGAKAFGKIRRQVAVAKRSLEDAVRGNPVMDHPAKRPENYEAFWQDYPRLPWDALCERYFPPVQDRRDPMLPVNREYYAKPYIRRHRRHVVHCCKVKLLNKLKKR